MSFSSQVARFRANSLDQTNKVKRQACLRLFRAVILDTPVLEGTLRGAWQCTTDQPAIGIPNSSDPMASVAAVLGSSRLEQTIFLTNNMPYAYPIEFLGWSHTKAPQGMVRKNALRFQQIVKDAARSVR